MKASVFIGVSLDGFIARENGELDWLPGSDGETESPEDSGFEAFMDSVDTLVMGRKTFEKVLSFGQWPYGNKHVVVLSYNLDTVPPELPDSVEIRSGTPQKLYDDLVTDGKKHLYIDGGTTIQGFLAEGLIDEITVTVVPVIIGKGIPLFGPVPTDVKLNHLETKTFKSGLIQTRYQVLN